MTAAKRQLKTEIHRKDQVSVINQEEEIKVGVFLKYISKNMLERKGRLFLLILSIAVSTGLLVASLGMIDVLLDSFIQPAKTAAEGQNISIGSNTNEVFFSLDDINAKGVENVKGSLVLTGIINENDEISYVGLSGRESYSGKLTEGSFTNANEKTCIISDRIAKEKNLNVGDTFSVSISGEKTDYRISAIAAADGAFYNDKKTSFTVIVPYAQMNELLKAGGKYNYVTAKATDADANIKDVVKSFNDANDKVKAAVLVDESTSGSESLTAGLYMMLALVCIVCIIIIHGAFKLIITERITTIGTFMSQGATRKKMERILLMEAALYGLVSSIFGVALGEGALILMTRAFSPLKEYGIYPDFNFNVVHALIGVVFAVLLSVISAMMPVRSIRKMQVKDVILNRAEQGHKKGLVRFIVGCGLLAVAIVGYISDAQWATDYSFIFFACAFVGLAMMARKFLKVVAGWLAKLFKGNTTAYLAMNNIKSSKLLRGNITLLVISLSAVFLITSFGTSMTNMVVSAYKEFNADYIVSNIIPSNADKTTTETMVEKLKNTKGIKADSVNPMGQTWAKSGDTEFLIESGDPELYGNFMQYLKLTTKYKDIFEKYKADTNKGILIADKVAKHTGKKAGDKFEIDVNGRKAEFNIIGTYDGGLYDNGQTVLVKSEDMKECFNITEAGWLTFDLDGSLSANDAEQNFKKTLSEMGATFMTKSEMEEDNVKSNQMIVGILSVFSYMALLITSIGIFNNISICFQQRRKEFAMMTSVGMNASKRKRLVLTESMTSVICAIAATIPFSIVIIGIMTKMAYALEMGFDMALSWSSVPLFAAAAAVIILIASLSTMRKSGKLNVVAELKYE